MSKEKLKILMVSAEASPFAKVGGLADVVGSLPPALNRAGCDVRLMLPLYGLIDRKKYRLKKIISDLPVRSAQKIREVNVWEGIMPKSTVKAYFIDYPPYFGKKEVYAKKNNSERYLFFSLAVLHVLPAINFIPKIIHCHDFHTALIPDLIKTLNTSIFNNAKVVYTIHNLNYQGQSNIEVLSAANLSKDSLKSLAKDAQDGDINFMVQGILNSDAVTIVSPTYAKEIKQSIYGAGLERIIKANGRKTIGILNGLDVDLFNPAKDKIIDQKYSVKTIKNKLKNKEALQKEVNLPMDKKIALAGLVSRFCWQKGLELITEKLMELPCQFIFLGTGEKKYEIFLKKMAKKYPAKISVQTAFNLHLAQMIYAGADIFLMPSRYEPCGLGQMIAMRYGTVPVVRATGGLADTVTPQVGFKFKNFNAAELYKKLDAALKVYYSNPKKWKQLQINGMKKDFSWDNSVKDYLKLYKKLLK